MARYYNFNILDDLDAQDANSAGTISGQSDVTAGDKQIVGDRINLLEMPEYQIIIPLSDIIGLTAARTICERIAFILEMSDEVIRYTEVTFYSKYPHMNKLGIQRLESSRTSNCISFFIDFEKESLRKLDRLFRRIANFLEQPNDYFIVADYEGYTGRYKKQLPGDDWDSMSSVGCLFGFEYKETKDYEREKQRKIESRK